MAQVFSRWPGFVSAAPGGEVKPGIPAWMVTTNSPRWSRDLIEVFKASALVGLPALAWFMTGLLHAGSDARYTYIPVALIATTVAIVMETRRRLSLRATRERYESIFERAGISMWLEDWTPVGERVRELRLSGITDMEAYYAERPEELRALRSKVMITDVSAFAIEEAGGRDKSAYIGSLDRLLPDTDQTFVQWLVAFARGDRFYRSEAHVTRADGSEGDALFAAALPADLAGFANIIATSFDVTAYKKEQAKLHATDASLARASRITAVGALSASIAHEVNSPLAAVVANAQAALRWLRQREPNIPEAMEAITDVVASATRARDVVARTRAFMSNAPIKVTSVDLVRVAREANLLIEREIREHGTAVHIQAADNFPSVEADPIQLQQVFVNLLLNAAQAMDRSEGARDVTISFSAEDGFVTVDVADNGPGIPPTELERVFEPFRSSKADGMGMGLAICRNCIDGFGGTISAANRPQGGAIFRFAIPREPA